MPACIRPLLTATGLRPDQWTLVWNDEFDGRRGASPDPAKWQCELGGEGWGNQELQYYTDRPENVALDGNGCLAITARQIASSAREGLACWYGPGRYTSARLQTRGRFTFTHGLVEARIRLPFGQGIWPALWMLGDNFGEVGWPDCGEIDIMENIGREPGRVHGTLHGPGYSGGEGIGFPADLPAGHAFADAFHLFAAEWRPDAVRWYLDNRLYGEATPALVPAGASWPFDHPFFLLLNVAVGGAWPGEPDATTTFPQVMLVDFVRVYQLVRRHDRPGAA